jgi:hypothetical protein
MNKPSETEINPYGDLDGMLAAKNWLGKSTLEGAALIASHPMRYQEDFAHMGDNAFWYYLGSVLAFLRSLDSAGEEDFTHGVIQSLCARLSAEDCMSISKDRAAMALEIIDYLVTHVKKFYRDDSFLLDQDMSLIKRYGDSLRHRIYRK